MSRCIVLALLTLALVPLAGPLHVTRAAGVPSQCAAPVPHPQASVYSSTADTYAGKSGTITFQRSYQHPGYFIVDLSLDGGSHELDAYVHAIVKGEQTHVCMRGIGQEAYIPHGDPNAPGGTSTLRTMSIDGYLDRYTGAADVVVSVSGRMYRIVVPVQPVLVHLAASSNRALAHITPLIVAHNWHALYQMRDPLFRVLTEAQYVARIASVYRTIVSIVPTGYTRIVRSGPNEIRTSGVTALSERPVFVGRLTARGVVRTTREQIVLTAIGASWYFTLVAPDRSGSCGC